MTKNECFMMEIEIHEFEAAEAEMELGIKNDEGQFEITLSERSKDILLAAIRCFREVKEFEEGTDEYYVIQKED